MAYTLLFWAAFGVFFSPTIGTWSIRKEAQKAMVAGGLVVQGSAWNFRVPLTWKWLRT